MQENYGGDSAIVYSLFVDVPIVCGGLMLGPCFVLYYFVSFLILPSLGKVYFCCVLNVMSLNVMSLNVMSLNVMLFDSSSWCLVVCHI